MSAALLLVPIVVIPRLAKLDFAPQLFVNEYTKVLGSTLVSVLVTLGWKRYDRSRHRKHAEREGRIVVARLLVAQESWDRLLLLSVPIGGGITAQGTFDADLARVVRVTRALLDPMERLLAGMNNDIREHLDELCHATSLLSDALRMLENREPRLEHALEHAQQSMRSFISILSKENRAWSLPATCD